MLDSEEKGSGDTAQARGAAGGSVSVSQQPQISIKQMIKTNRQFPIYGDFHSGNISDLLRNNIQKSTYFSELQEIRTFEDVLSEII